MKKLKKSKVALVVLLAIVMLIQLAPIAFAAGQRVNFPLIALNGIDTVADANTTYIVTIDQDTDTKMITATLAVTNGSTGVGAKNIVFTGIGVELTFNSQISPYRYNPTDTTDTHPYDATRFFTGGPNDSLAEFSKYCYAPTPGFETIGSSTIQNNTAGRFLGAKISTVDDEHPISLAPGAQIIIAKMYFMPTNGQDILDLDMFSFKWQVYNNRMIRLTTWLANGTRYVVSNESYPTSTSVYVLSPNTFKIHMTQTKPNVSANMDDRVINGYDAATMEWSYTAAGPYSSGAPIVKDEDHTIYVRKMETAYGGADAEYGNYKKYLASEPTAVAFDKNFFSCENDVYLTKTGANISSTDGKTHVNDIIQYTVVAGNDGDYRSVWADAVMTDEMPDGVTFDGSVTLNGDELTSTDYTFSGGVLTVPLGDIPGETYKTVTFRVKINADAYGMEIMNSVAVNGKDGDDGDDLDRDADEDGGGRTVVDRSEKPDVDDITEGDSTITGTGEPGATIIVTLPDGTELETTVDSNGDWSVDVPAGSEPKTGETVIAVQIEPDKEPSEEVEVIVGGRPDPDKYRNKTSTNLSRTDGTRHVGDTLEYTVTAANNGDAKSLWTDVDVIDELPEEVDFVAGSVKINNIAVGSPTAVYDDATHTLTVLLGDIAGGSTRIVTFEAVINETAYGKSFKNTAVIDGEGVDDDDDTVVGDRSPMPVFDEINEGDKVVTGSGVAGATVVVYFPHSTLTAIATVNADEEWSVNVPITVNLVENDVVKAVQTVSGLDPSLTAEEVVQGKKPVIPDMSKTSENKTSNDGKTRVGDTILYTVNVSNIGSPKSVWINAYMSDPIPDGVTLKESTVLLDDKVPTYSSYNETTRVLYVWIEGNIVGGQTRVITFETTVDADAFGKTIKNSASVEGKGNDDDGPDVDDETEEDGDGHTVTGKSETPTVDDVTRGDDIITGTGEPGAEIIVTLEDGTELTTTVDDDGNWEVDVPSGKEPDTGDTITVIQIEPGKEPSDEVTTIVKDKNYRAVTGFVWPMVDNDLGLGDSFLKKHDIVVELRATFQTPAAAGLSVTSVLIPEAARAGLGEFTIENVPFGTYVLVIKRPGFLVRAMNITVSPSDPDMILLTPPGTEDDGVFNLWWGDCNDDFRIDNEDVMMIMELLNIGVNANDVLYNPACDLNGDGLCDNEDIMMVLERWNLYASQYAGAETVEFFE